MTQRQHPAFAALSPGKTTDYPRRYDASLLRPVPRKLGRDKLAMSDKLPFHGADIWTLYELSWLNADGLPQVATGSLEVDAQSDNLVESKSFKLYLNSFNQTRFASWQSVTETLQRDLAACVQGAITVQITPLSQQTGNSLTTLSGECIDNQPVRITDYQLNADYLATACQPPQGSHAPGSHTPGSHSSGSYSSGSHSLGNNSAIHGNLISETLVNETLVSHLLKSNCLITQQPDWASVQIRYSGNKIDRQQLLRYLVSYRLHNEFHEHCVERIFYDLMRHCRPQILSVYARYTRRGGLDINPWRSNDPHFTPERGRLVRQ